MRRSHQGALISKADARAPTDSTTDVLISPGSESLGANWEIIGPIIPVRILSETSFEALITRSGHW